MIPMITADQARELAGRSLEEKIESLWPLIKRAAINKQRNLFMGDFSVGDDKLWVYGGYYRTEEWKSAKKILENFGYKVSFRCPSSPDGQPLGTVIEW
jgi:hypothetical protein